MNKEQIKKLRDRSRELYFHSQSEHKKNKKGDWYLLYLFVKSTTELMAIIQIIFMVLRWFDLIDLKGFKFWAPAITEITLVIIYILITM